ncbi:MAG TPA: hypothetical protein PKE04_01490 [Clostridia bacterium]|nr:hypothetical protein [Clostridia bacterium]
MFSGLLEQFRASPKSVEEGYLRQRYTELLARMRVFIVPNDRDVPRIVLP